MLSLFYDPTLTSIHDYWENNRLDYTDLSDVSDYAAEAVMYCTMKGMMRAKTDKEFMPKSDATRAEVALAVQKFMQRNE